MTKPVFGTGGEALTLFNGSLNSVEVEVNAFLANLIYIGLPFVSNDSLSAAFSFAPKQRIMQVTGVYRGTEAQIKAFIDEVDGVANDGEQTGRSYKNAVEVTYSNMRINKFDYTLSYTSNGLLRYTMELFESAI